MIIDRNKECMVVCISSYCFISKLCFLDEITFMFRFLILILLFQDNFCGALTVEDTFQKWLIDNGATLNDVELFRNPETNYRGWLTTKDRSGGLSPDQGLVMLIPQDLLFSKSSVLAEEGLNFLFKNAARNGIENHEFEIMVTGLIVERLAGPKSKWGPCMDMVTEDSQLRLPLNFLKPPLLNLIGFSEYYIQRIGQQKKHLRESYLFLSKFIFPHIPSIATLSTLEAKRLFNWAYLYQYSHGTTGHYYKVSEQGETEPISDTREMMMSCGVNFLNHHGDARSYGPVRIDRSFYHGVFITRDHAAREEIFNNYDQPGKKRHCNFELFLRYGFVLDADRLRDCYVLNKTDIQAPPTFGVSLNGEPSSCGHALYITNPRGLLVTLQEPLEFTNVHFYPDSVPKVCTYKLLLDHISREHRRVENSIGLRSNKHKTRTDEMLIAVLRGQLRILKVSSKRLSELLRNTGAEHVSL